MQKGRTALMLEMGENPKKYFVEELFELNYEG